jgi:hypothetical protein
MISPVCDELKTKAVTTIIKNQEIILIPHEAIMILHQLIVPKL